MRLLPWVLGLLAVPMAVAQHSITLNWQLPPTNATWTHACGSAQGYDCLFNIYRNEVLEPTTPCSTNGGDYELIGQTSTANATTFEDDSVLLGSSHCYGVSTLQNSVQSPTTFLSTGGDMLTQPLPATVYAGLTFYPMPAPCRMVDTRYAPGPLGGPSLVANAQRDFPLLSSNCGVPSTVQVYALTITAIPTSYGNFVMWPTGMPKPLATTIDPSTTSTTSALVEAGTNGSVSGYVEHQSMDIVIDCYGYFAP